jgi:hypothetical protein
MEGHTHLMDPQERLLDLLTSPIMVSDPKTNAWNLLKDQFDASMRKEEVRQDDLEIFLDGGVRRRFGELIAWAAGHKAKGYHGPWPPGPYRAPR